MKILSENLPTFEDYDRENCLYIPGFFNSHFIALLQSFFSREFIKRISLEEATEYLLVDKVLKFKLLMIFNQPDFLDTMSAIVGARVSFTRMRLYYVDSTCNNLDWHDDSYSKDNRIAALRIELSDSPYEGGDFLFKDKKDSEILTFKTHNPGDALLFKVEVGRYLHMVTPVISGTRKSIIVFLCSGNET